MNLIGLTGRAGAGKDTVADILVSLGYAKVSFADPLKRFCKDLFDFSDEQLWGPSDKRNEPDERYCRFPRNPMTLVKEVNGDRIGEYRDTQTGREFVPLYLTPRYALQRLGTEWGRDCCPGIWVDYAMRVVGKIRAGQCRYNALEGIVPNAIAGYTGIVIPDVRFPNEAEAILGCGGYVWRIEREGSGLEGDAGQHASETGMDQIECNETIQNDGSVRDLENRVRNLLQSLGHIA